jgi:hypothetical protein
MSARKASKEKTKAKDRPIRPGQANPHWGRAHVTISQRQNWIPDEMDKSDGRRTPPITLSAGPGVEARRVDVSLGQSYLTERVNSGDPKVPKRFMLNLGIKAWVGMRGGYTGFNETVTLAQALSFEEAVRAVFRAAREEGILPRVHHDQV